MPQDEARDHFKKIIADVVAAEGQVLLGFRDVPVDNSSLSKAPEIAGHGAPARIQVFIGRGDGVEETSMSLRAPAVRAAQGDFQPGLWRDRKR
jgi:glutamate synthase (NADPH/NADH) large chain